MQQHITSPDFIKGLDFAYIETYSLLRGKKGRQFKAWIKEEKAKLVAPDSIADKERLKYLNSFRKYTQYLTSESGNLHPTSECKNTLNKDHNLVEELVQILSTPIVNQMDWMCGPIYRDAIIFYDGKGNRLAVLNVCLSCEYMQLEDKTFVDADVSVYAKLKAFFIELGHNIEADSYDD